MMKSYIFNSGKNNENKEEEKKNKTTLEINKKNYDEESKKEKFIMERYAPYYLDFFKESSTSSPMFVDTSDFRCTKTITISCDIIVNSGESCGILFDPFDSYNPAQKWIFATSTQVTPLTSFKTKLNSYSSYKVVLASAKLKQISILTLNDGFGTVFDAILAPSSFDPKTQGENPLNINISEKFKRDTIDGRKGIKAFILGNPYADWTNVGNPQPIINPTLFPEGDYKQNFIPGSIFSLGPEGIFPTLTYRGNVAPITMMDKYCILNGAADRAIFNYDCWMSNFKKGMKLWIKITQPTQQTSFKFVYKVALEVIPGTDLSEDVMTYAPPFNYQTQRIFSTIYENVNCLKILNDNDNEENNIQYYEKKMSKDYVYASTQVDQLVVKNIFQRRRNIIQKNNEPIHGEVLPEYVKNAVEFAGENISKINSTSEYQRYLRNSTFEPPKMNYQYFPVINENVVETAILVVKEGAEGTNYIKFEFLDPNGNPYESTLYYEKDDLKEEKDYAEYVSTIIQYLNNDYYSQFPNKFTIRFFAAKKIADRSYGAALMMALMNSPCGQFSTGTLKMNDENNAMEFQMMNQETIKTKCQNASAFCPLIAPFEESNANTYLISGLMEEIESNILYTFSTVSEFIIFSYVSPSLKNCKQTPAHKYSGEINNLLSNMNVTNARLFLYLYNYSNPQIIQNFLLNPDQKIPFPPTSFTKCNPNRFGRYIFYGQTNRHYVDLQDYTKKNPTFLISNKIPHFYYKDNLYVLKPNAMGILPKNIRRMTTPEVLEASKKLNEALNNITIEDIKTILKQKLLYDPRENALNREMERFQLRNNDNTMTDERYQRLVVQQTSNFGEEAKKAIEKLNSIVKNIRKAVEGYGSGNSTLLSSGQVATYMGINNKYNGNQIDDLRTKYPVLYVEELIKSTDENELKRALFDAGIASGNLTRPSGQTNWKSLLKLFNQTDKYMLELINEVNRLEKEDNENQLRYNQTNTNMPVQRIQNMNQRISLKNIQPKEYEDDEDIEGGVDQNLLNNMLMEGNVSFQNISRGNINNK